MILKNRGLYSVPAVLGTPSLLGTVASLSSNPHHLASKFA
jgi:hypothetical protein